MWTPTHTSGWLTYAAVQQGHEWQVTEASGVKYLQAWASDGAANISTNAAKAYINYQPANQAIDRGQTHFYRYQVEQGKRLTARLEVSSGDPDLYVWAPDYEMRAPWVSQAPAGNDLVTFVAPVSGIYQIEVWGYTAATYRLLVDVSTDQVQQQNADSSVRMRTEPATSNGTKPFPSRPHIALNSEPGTYVPTQPLPTATATATSTVTPTITSTATSTVIATPTPSVTVSPTDPALQTESEIYLPVIQK